MDMTDRQTDRRDMTDRQTDRRDMADGETDRQDMTDRRTDRRDTDMKKTQFISLIISALLTFLTMFAVHTLSNAVIN